MQLKYTRTPDLFRRADADPPDDHDRYCDKRGVRFAAGDGTYITFWFDLSQIYWNTRDLNRIETATAALRDRLLPHGCRIDVTCAANWTQIDFPHLSEVTRVRENVDAFRRGFGRPQRWKDLYRVYAVDADGNPTAHETMNWQQANALEWDLHCIDSAIDRIGLSQFYSGEIYGGEV